MNRKKFFRRRNRIITILIALVVVAAIVEQLRLPPEERTWHGDIAGIPYDFRFPTVERLRSTFWNPNDPRLFVPRAFGVGWDINLYRLLHSGASRSAQ